MSNKKSVVAAGVILESEELHRLAYNAAFKHFDVRCNGVGEIDQWSVDFYDMLQVCQPFKAGTNCTWMCHRP